MRTFSSYYRSILLVVFVAFAMQSEAKIKLKTGLWLGELQLNEKTELPFQFSVAKSKSAYSLTIYNAEERILLDELIEINDSIDVSFPSFHSTLRFIIDDKTKLNGFWINHNKKGNYRIPFTARNKSQERFEDLTALKPSINVSGNWKVTFNYSKDSPYHAKGVFTQDNKGKVAGTFLTETGDYRFLEGKVGCKQFSLSCFDGSHAFLFESSAMNDTLYGTFYSGKHWSGEWMAVRDDKFELRDADSLTYLTSKDFSFNLKDLAGNDFSFPNDNYKDKVTIVQIMGTWCPNCMDETNFYKDLYAKYHDKGLEVIAIGYEAADNWDDQVAKINRLKEKYDLDFKFLVGGKANKGLASEHFSMLNEIISFPTSIYIDKQGNVVRIHTGFNGPGTGEKYTQYVQKTTALVESLLML